MYILGHMVWGYLICKLTGRVIGRDVPLYIALLLSTVADFDLYFLHAGLAHHTYTHSTIVWTPILLLALAAFGKSSLLYIVGIAQHFLVADFIVGKVPLILPISGLEFGLNLGTNGRNEMIIELSAFMTAALIAYRSGELKRALEVNRRNILMILPLFALISLTLLFANEIGIDLVEYGFTSRSISLISVSHVLLAAFLMLSTVQGIRGFGAVSRDQLSQEETSKTIVTSSKSL